MDPIPFTIASAVAAGLVVAVTQLYRRQLDSDARCHAQNTSLSEEIKATKDKLIEIHQTRAIEYATLLTRTDETARICARVLRRYEQSPVPPSTGETTAIHRVIK